MLEKIKTSIKNYKLTKLKVVDLQFSLSPVGVYYSDVTGFFLFRGEIFYRENGRTAKNVKTKETFSDFVRSLDGWSTASTKEISRFMVTPLYFK